MTIVASNNLTVSNVNDGTITHTAYAYNADGTDGFTTVYPNLNLLNFKSGLKIGRFLAWADGLSMVPNPARAVFDYVSVIPGTTYTINSNWDKTERIAIYAYDSNDIKNATFIYDNGSAKWVSPSTIERVITEKTTLSIPDGMNFIRVVFLAKDTSATLTLQDMLDAKTKVEQGSTATPWMPSSSEVTTADWPKYIGHYMDFMQADSTNPSDYTFGPMRGDDGVGVTSTVITYANSTSGTTAPSTGWTSSIPSPVKGQYLWTKTVWTYTDNSSETGYSVTYISKDGNNGSDGISGIIVSSVAPASPQTGQLWQDTSTTPQLIKKWTGSSWVIWEFYAENIKAVTLETVSAKIGKIYNEFDNSSGGIDNKGTITIGDSVKVVYYLGNSSTTIDLVTSSSGQGLFTQYLPDKTDASKFKQSWYMPTGLYFTDSINNWTGQITAENITLVPWTNLTYLSGYTTAENNPCQYRKIKNLDGSYTVQFRGQVKPVSGSFPGTNSESNFKIIANLPADIRPSTHTFLSAVGDMAGTQTIRIGALSDGRIQVGVRGTASSYIGINSLIYTI